MVSRSFLTRILDDEHLTRGLGDAEARILVEWLVERSEESVHDRGSEDKALPAVAHWCRRARAIGRFLALWSYEADHGAACQLAASERFSWPFPTPGDDPCDILGRILSWERDHITG
ncbi:MAG: hypothetical protein L0Y72_05955 [Gemmataceae bacterium]|nr:hypothetical protein [Gemmataceae bacterium]MCI0738569.1 hypothetical protein [Gemmataceae bacterium]